ncbi:MAG TPA: DUF6763 family protein [Gammaproteobacteria bacterium]|nr:DUF6763 family protein [Gammaproteobacteria bacterium]
MPSEVDPIVGHWYMREEGGQEFEVTSVNEAEGVVEVQDIDGDVEEIDLEEWYELEIEPTEPPEEWSGGYDPVARAASVDDEADFYADDDAQTGPWDEPLDDYSE